MATTNDIITNGLTRIQDKWDYFDDVNYYFLNHRCDILSDFNGTCLEPMLNEIRTLLTASEVKYKIDFVYMVPTCDAENVTICFDIIWIDNNTLHTFPFVVESNM